MKELVQIWSRMTNRRYSSVNSNDRELREIANNRLQRNYVDSSNGHMSECEGLNSKFEDVEFNERKDAIINRLFERRRKGNVARHPKSLFLFLMLGFISLTIGFFILFLHPYDFLFKLKIIMSDGGEIFEIWRKPQVELYCKIYLFNVTNAEDYLSGKSEKLIMKEVGPYVYREHLEHTNVTFNDNGTLSTIPIHPLTWMPELSEGNKEDDELFLPHIALLSIANVVAKQGYIARFGLNNLISLTNSKPLLKMTAKEFMMGYKSKLLSLGNTFLPGWIHFDKLGLIDRMYDFEGDFETIFTGEHDVRVSGLVDTYKGSTELPHWKGEHCSNVQYASDGTKFKGQVTMNETLKFFRKSMCRSAPLVPVKEGVKSGLSAYMYTFEDNLLDNGKYNEKNKCFCRDGKCLPSGLLDVTDCYYGFPIALSYPHFYKGDDVLFSKVEGLTPDKEKHETRFWIQPDSGLPLDVSSKFQINMALEDLSSITNAGNFSNMYLPMLWFDISMSQLPESLEYKFNLYLNVLPVVEKSAMYLLFATGFILVTISVYKLTFQVMFRTFDKKSNRVISDIWDKNGKNRDIYKACEIPLSGDSTDSDEGLDPERRPSGFIKSHSDKIKELSLRLGDRVYDSVGSVKDKVKDELTHVRYIFKEHRKDSLITAQDESNSNDAYKSDSSEENLVSENEDEFKLEVVDDEFDGPKHDRRVSVNSEAINRINKLENSNPIKEDLILYISD